MLDDQGELVDRYLVGRQRLAEGSDDGGGGLLAGAIAQCHVGYPGRAGGAGDAGVPGDLERGGLGGFEDRGQGVRGGHGEHDAFGVVHHAAEGDGRGAVPLSLSLAFVSI